MDIKLPEILTQFKGKNILVFGDVVLDQFLYGEISRVSREAPVLILDYERTVDLLGGGANALHNIWSLGAEVFPAGVIGRDASGEKLLSLLAEKSIDVSGLLPLNEYVTPTKTRILAGSSHSSKQQLVRIDKGAEFRLDAQIQKQVVDKIDVLFKRKLDGVIVSDYGYKLDSDSIVDHILTRSRAEHIPVVVDSRFNMRRYNGVTAITPNISEVEEAYQVKIENKLNLLESFGKSVLKEQRLEALLITRGRYGMTLFESDKPPAHIPVSGSDEVADVTGAGDTVVATFALALAAGANFYSAARLANYAAGIVVMKRGTATVNLKELEAAVPSS